jgi:2-polyprenyl-3-methyl-5-hydroxy-6-metoxy-1,4-benzoquinol methylase
MSGSTKSVPTVLAVIASWGRSNDQYLALLINEYSTMQSFKVHVVVLSNVEREVPEGVELLVVDPNSRKLSLFSYAAAAVQYPWLLREQYREWKRHLDFPFAHKQILADRVDDYDLFVYSEDDTLITEKNLLAFQRVSSALPSDEIPGFLRYEYFPDGTRNYPEIHGIFHWDPASVRSRSGYTLAFFTNEHSACYVLTRGQLQRAIDSGGYLVGPHAEMYDLLCTAATDPYTQCGLQKFICISHLEDFLIHHLPNKYVGTRFGVGDAELWRQVGVLLWIGGNGNGAASLFQTTSKFEYGIYSKDYYEPIHSELIAAIPSGTRTVLSIGCGWGATERSLAAKGMQVVAVPLDPVIPGGAQAEGIELVNGSLAEAREKLTARRFDCLLLSNVLHLVPDPVQVLSSFSSLLSPEGISVAVVPNTSRLGSRGKVIRSKQGIGKKVHEGTEVHACSRKVIGNWFKDAGMPVETFIDLLGPRARKYSYIAAGLADSWIASEFVVIAKKASDNPAF